ncbi:MAG: hypothetical protein E7675_04160 [Ruminococcaceae bacterium]|nr:hypothetical protein [Oscillospiraceae bacterium]
MARITWEDVMKKTREYGDKYDFINVRAVGSSFRGRRIPMVSIGRGHKRVLYVGAHHGAEGITADILLRYIDEVSRLIIEGKRIGNAHGELFINTRQVDIIPMLNPDGVEISVKGVDKSDVMYERLLRMNGGSDDFTQWQANGRGVDLNHNYNDMFGEYKMTEGKMGIYGGARGKYSGEYPESEPETAAICHYIRSMRPRHIITLHSQGEELYYESRGFALAEAEKNAVIAQRLTGYRMSRTEGTASSGGLLDWVTRECRIPCLTVECGKGKNPLPEKDARSIYAAVRPLLMNAPTMFSGA